MINLIVTSDIFIQDGVEKTPTDTFEKGYIEKIDDTFFHIELNNQITGFVVNKTSINGVVYENSNEAISKLKEIRNWMTNVPEP